MGTGDLLRRILEIRFGLAYLIGAMFNLMYTMRHGDDFYGSFADKALLEPARKLIRIANLAMALLQMLPLFTQ